MDFSEAGNEDSAVPAEPNLSDAEPQRQSHHSESLAGTTTGSGTEKPGNVSQNVSGVDEQHEQQDMGRTSTNLSRPRRPCRAPGCQADVSRAKSFNWRYRICEEHRSAQSVSIDGEPMRFCQMCAKFQPLEEFSGRIFCLSCYLVLIELCFEILEKHASVGTKTLWFVFHKKLRAARHH